MFRFEFGGGQSDPDGRGPAARTGIHIVHVRSPNFSTAEHAASELPGLAGVNWCAPQCGIRLQKSEAHRPPSPKQQVKAARLPENRRSPATAPERPGTHGGDSPAIGFVEQITETPPKPLCSGQLAAMGSAEQPAASARTASPSKTARMRTAVSLPAENTRHPNRRCQDRNTEANPSNCRAYRRRWRRQAPAGCAWSERRVRETRIADRPSHQTEPNCDPGEAQGASGASAIQLDSWSSTESGSRRCGRFHNSDATWTRQKPYDRTDTIRSSAS